MVTITAFYAALLALLFVILSRNVFGYRRRAGIALGDGDDAVLLRRMRVHANFAEYAPFVLLLIGFAEIQDLMPVFVHLLGVALVAGRTVHALGVSREPEDYRFRVAGMALTLGALSLAAVANVLLSVAHWTSAA